MFELKDRIFSAALYAITLFAMIGLMYVLMYPFFSKKPYTIYISNSEVAVSNMDELYQAVNLTLPKTFEINIPDLNSIIVDTVNVQLTDLRASYISGDTERLLRMYMNPGLTDIFNRKATSAINKTSMSNLSQSLKSGNFGDVATFIKNVFFENSKKSFYISRASLEYTTANLDEWASGEIQLIKSKHPDVTMTKDELIYRVEQALAGN